MGSPRSLTMGNQHNTKLCCVDEELPHHPSKQQQQTLCLLHPLLQQLCCLLSMAGLGAAGTADTALYTGREMDLTLPLLHVMAICHG